MRIEEDERQATDRALLLAAAFYWHTDDSKNARRLSQQCLDANGNNVTALAIRGWVDLTCGKETLAAKANQYFDAVLNDAAGPKDLLCMMGKAKYHELKKAFGQTLDILSQVVVLYSTFVPALVEKAKVQMMMGDWEQSLETSQRVLASERSNIEGLRLSILHSLARESRVQEACGNIQELISSIDRNEPKNATLCFKVSRPFARLCGRNEQVLRLTLSLIDRAKRLSPDNSQYWTEYAYQQTLLGEYQGAKESYQQAAQLDETNSIALYGVIYCIIHQDKLEEAEEQLEFLREISVSLGRSSEMTFLGALLAWRRRKERDQSVKLLDEALSLHIAATKTVAPGYEFYVKLNPDFLLEIAKEYLQHAALTPLAPGETPGTFLNRGVKLLETLSKQVPGLVEAQLLLAKGKFVLNDFEAAQKALAACLRLDSQFAEAHLFMALIGLKTANYRLASSSLDQALSLDFDVRNDPQFHLIKAEVAEATNDSNEALKSLEAAINLPGVKKALPTNTSGRKNRVLRLTVQDRASIFVMLASIYTRLNRVTDANKLVQDAIVQFAGTTEEVRVLIANSELAMKKGEPETALNMLRTLPPDNPHYAKAKLAMAEIHLKHRNDRKSYARCFGELVEKNPTVSNYMLFGEALMKIQEPEEAIRAFEQALALNRADTSLAVQIGRALVQTHDYNRAIEYYESALRADPKRNDLRSDLASLYLRLKRFDHATRVLNESLQDRSNAEDITVMKRNVQNFLLLAEVQLGMSTSVNDGQLPGPNPNVVEAYNRAKSLQADVLLRVRGEPFELLKAERATAARICYGLGDYYLKREKNLETAFTHFNDALRHDETHEISILALAKLCMTRGQLEQCQAQCITLLRLDPANEQASMMLAELMLQKGEYEAATYYFQQLLEKKPNNYSALVDLIHLLRRAGKLGEAPRYLKLAEKSSPRANQEAGLHYCKGVYNRYVNNPQDALTELNMARHDPAYGENALVHMIELYLNPDNENLWDESQADGQLEHLRAVDTLLEELTQKNFSSKLVVYQCYSWIATKQKQNIEKALSRLTNLLNQEREYVPALLCMAVGLMTQKQTPKARNALKRIAKMQYQPELADDFEKSWLLLSDIYVTGGKYDLAQEQCKKCLLYNKSCGKAWEYMGLIMEKEQSYKDAAEHYEKAWKISNETSASVGFKLSFNYLKAKRFIDAINICHKVLAMYPDYPKIRKDILEKARSLIRS
eukprot:GILJ01006001.1.p1 GENE.GILJ01006001.1~~GILJ01006001.1.p1  ORF type:complete len:1335 (+),score=250.67 GILJ01006001.1:335-4006(+)